MEEKSPKTFAVLSSFWLKIIAIVTMTIDHIGWMLSSNVDPHYWLAIVCRYIGRISLPLFCLMVVEGVLHTKKMGNYLLRLGIIATAICGALIFVEYVPFFDFFRSVTNKALFLSFLDFK